MNPSLCTRAAGSPALLRDSIGTLDGAMGTAPALRPSSRRGRRPIPHAGQTFAAEPVLRLTALRPQRLETTMTTLRAPEPIPLRWAAHSPVIAAGAAHLAIAWLAPAPPGDRADRLAGGGLSVAPGSSAALDISASIDPVGRAFEHALGAERAIGLLAWRSPAWPRH